MLKIIGAVFELVVFILKNILEKDAQTRKENDELRKQAKDAIISGDANRITNVFDKLRRK